MIRRRRDVLTVSLVLYVLSLALPVFIDQWGRPFHGWQFALAGLFLHWVFVLDLNLLPLVAVWFAHPVFLYGWFESRSGRTRTGLRAGWLSAGLAGLYLLCFALARGSPRAWGDVQSWYEFRPRVGYFFWVASGLALAVASARPAALAGTKDLG